MNSRAGQVFEVDQMRSQVLHDDTEDIELQGMKHVSDEPHA